MRNLKIIRNKRFLKRLREERKYFLYSEFDRKIERFEEYELSKKDIREMRKEKKEFSKMLNIFIEYVGFCINLENVSIKNK